MVQQYTPYILSPYSNHTVSDIFWIATWKCFLSICQYLFNTFVYVSKLTLYFCILCTMMLLCFINIASSGSYLCSPLPWWWRVIVVTLVSIWCTYFRVMFLTRSGEGREWPLTISKLRSPPSKECFGWSFSPLAKFQNHSFLSIPVILPSTGEWWEPYIFFIETYQPDLVSGQNSSKFFFSMLIWLFQVSDFTCSPESNRSQVKEAGKIPTLFC